MILAVLQARVSSNRLPGKVLKPILGMPMILRQIERVRRSNRRWPRKSSRPLTWWLSAAGVTDSSCAASVKLRLRAVASKARSALSGGSRVIQFTTSSAL